MVSMHRKRRQTRKHFPGALTHLEETFKSFHKLEKHADKLSRLLIELAKEQQSIMKQQVRICKLLPEELNEYRITNVCQCDNLKLQLVVLIKQADSSMSKNEILQRLNEIVYPERESVEVSAASRRSIKTTLSHREEKIPESHIEPPRKTFLYSKTVEMKHEDGVRSIARRKPASNAQSPDPTNHQTSSKKRKQIRSMQRMDRQASAAGEENSKSATFASAVADEWFESCPQFAFPEKFRKSVLVGKIRFDSRASRPPQSRSSSEGTERPNNNHNKTPAATNQASSIIMHHSSLKLHIPIERRSLWPSPPGKADGKQDKLSRTTNQMESRIIDSLQLLVPAVSHRSKT